MELDADVGRDLLIEVGMEHQIAFFFIEINDQLVPTSLIDLRFDKDLLISKVERNDFDILRLKDDLDPASDRKR